MKRRIYENAYNLCGKRLSYEGSHRVIDKFDELIAKYGLEDEVELKASFCMDQCTGNIGARVDERQIYDLTRENAEEVFLREILGN